MDGVSCAEDGLQVLGVKVGTQKGFCWPRKRQWLDQGSCQRGCGDAPGFHMCGRQSQVGLAGGWNVEGETQRRHRASNFFCLRT